MYNYMEAIKEDIRDYIEWEKPRMTTRADIEHLEDTLWVDDGVTGNASGSYTFNTYKAREYVSANMELLAEACAEFGAGYEEVGKMICDNEWEKADVTIRCYLLNIALYEVLAEDHDIINL